MARVSSAELVLLVNPEMAGHTEVAAEGDAVALSTCFCRASAASSFCQSLGVGGCPVRATIFDAAAAMEAPTCDCNIVASCNRTWLASPTRTRSLTGSNSRAIFWITEDAAEACAIATRFLLRYPYQLRSG